MRKLFSDTNTLKFKGWVKSIYLSDNIVRIDLIDNKGILTAKVVNKDIVERINSLKFPTYATIYCELNSINESGWELNTILDILEGTNLQFDYRELNKRHFYNRLEKPRKILLISNWVVRFLRNFFHSDNWIEINTPLLSTIAEACEDTSSLFWIENYYSKNAFLVQTSQFYLESLLVPFEKVFSISHSFRKEASSSYKHLCEYTHIEAEAAWYEFENLQELVSKVIVSLLDEIRKMDTIFELCSEINPNFSKNINSINIPFPSITYDECIKLLNKKGIKIQWGNDFSIEQEQILTREFNKPFFISYWPKNIKAFYMKEYEKNSDLVESFDLLLPCGYGELVGASVRENNPDKVWNRLTNDAQLKKLKSEMLDINLYQWYLDLRKYSSVPHGGFGLGLERLVTWLLDLKDISKALPYPRLPNEINII